MAERVTGRLVRLYIHYAERVLELEEVVSRRDQEVRDEKVRAQGMFLDNGPQDLLMRGVVFAPEYIMTRRRDELSGRLEAYREILGSMMAEFPDVGFPTRQIRETKTDVSGKGQGSKDMVRYV